MMQSQESVIQRHKRSILSGKDLSELEKLQKIPSEHNDYLDLFTQINIIEDSFEFVHLIFHFDPFQCVHVGSAFEKIYGYSCKEIYNRADLFYEAAHPEDTGFLIQQIKLLIKKGYHEFNYRIVSKNGEIKYLKTNVWYQQGEGQSFVMTCFQKDVTGQMVTGNRLKKSAQRHHHLTEIATALNSIDDFAHKLQMTIDRIGASLQTDHVNLYEIDNEQMFCRYIWAKHDPVILPGIVLKTPPLHHLSENTNTLQFTEGDTPEGFMQYWERPERVQTLLIIPVRVKNKMFGFVEVISKKKRIWKDEDLCFADTVGNILAYFYDRKTINEELNQNYLNKELIAGVSSKLNQYVNDDEHVLKTVLGYIAMNYPCTERVCIYMYDKEINKFKKRYNYVNPSLHLKYKLLDEYDASLFEEILPLLNEGKPFYADHFSQHDSDFYKFLNSLHIKSILFAPLFVHSKLYGFLSFSMVMQNHIWDKSGIELTQSLAGSISHFIERQSMMKNLTNSEKKIKGISAKLPGCMFQITMLSTEDITLDYISPQFEKMSGIKPPRKVILKKIQQIIHPNDQDAFFNMKKELERSHTEISFEGRFYFSSSIVKWLIVKATMLEVKPTGELIYNGLIMDITENKQTELKLSDANVSIQSIINNMEAGILLVDDYNDVLYFNEKMEKLLGSEFNKNSDPSGILDATFHLVKDSIALKSHTRDMMKKRLEERDRELFFYATAEFFIRDYVPVFRDNRFFAHLFIFRNITHSKLQDLEVQKSYKRVRTIMDHSDVGVVLLSNNEKVLIVNNQFLRMFYIKEPSSFFVNQLFRVLWEKMCENVQIDGLSREQIFETACSGKRIINKEILINDSATLQCIIEPVVYENQMQKGIHETLIQVIDITPQRSIEHTLRTARMEAEAIANAKSHILTSMSHEIRTPLNGILGFSSILKEMLTDPYMHEMAEEIEQSGHRLLDTINAILDFSMLQSEKHPFKKTSVSVNHILHDQINTFEPMALQKKLYIYAKIKGVIGIAIAEQVLCKILYNLINNAIKYTTTGGVTVEASIVYVEGSEWLDLRVIDTGVGIDEFKHRTIFEPFRQESEGYGRAFEGTGLGLSLVKEYIQKLNGKLHLASRKDEGSTFMILLPNAYYENKDVAPEIIGTPPKQTEGFSNFDARSRFSRRNH